MYMHMYIHIYIVANYNQLLDIKLTLLAQAAAAVNNWIPHDPKHSKPSEKLSDALHGALIVDRAAMHVSSLVQVVSIRVE